MSEQPCGCGGHARCGCCEGTEALTPLAIANRPGLAALAYRVGTHATFFRTMVAGLTSHQLEDGRRPLRRLTTRATSDPAIALLDAWATVADVLTFYQERIANEGYLLTATERRSVLELARLVGYRLRPGVSASVYLAFTLDDDFDIAIPAGTRARSLPGPGELPQGFETEEALRARTEWNALSPRLTRPISLPPGADFEGTRTVWLEGTATGLAVNDPLLLACGSGPQPYTIRAVEPDPAAGRTRVTYAPFNAPFNPPFVEPSGAPASSAGNGAPQTRLTSIVQALRRDPSLPPASRFQLTRTAERAYGASADLGPQLLVQFDPKLRDTLYTAYANAAITGPRTAEPCRVQALRVKAPVYGHNAPPAEVTGVVVLVDHSGTGGTPSAADSPAETERLRTLPLDTVYDGIMPGSWVVIDRVDALAVVTQVEQVRTRTRNDFDVAVRVTELVLLESPWGTAGTAVLDVRAAVRNTTVYALSEELELAEEPIPDSVGGDVIELDGLYDGLEAGRWLFVKGARADVRGDDDEIIEGIEGSELVMLAGVVHDVHAAPGREDEEGQEDDVEEDGDDESDDQEQPDQAPDTLHTRLTLSAPLAYEYRRDTVTINANVVRATHGETQMEALGSGDAAKAFQAFTLTQDPLTFVAAPTPEGVESTLEVRVDRVRWPEEKTLLYLGPDDRGYITSTDDDGTTTVTFGDGTRGARLPSGVENVTAVYRSGIGKGGNVVVGKISQLATRPLGVKEVVNPQRASGGADPESRDQARRNVPLAVLALDRLVAVQDYADFTRTFAGIGKASAAGLSDGRRAIVHLTIAGADDGPIDASSDLFRNLMLALTRFGDPNTPLRVELREAVFLIVAVRVRVLEDHLWKDVEPKLRSALLNTLGFERRELGQDVLLSEVIGTMQAVEGVAWVDVDLLDGVSETDAADPDTLAAKLEGLTAGDQPKQRVVVHLARIDSAAAEPAPRIRRAQLAYLNPALPDTLLLTEVTP
jgi:hypothetical protein